MYSFNNLERASWGTAVSPTDVAPALLELWMPRGGRRLQDPGMVVALVMLGAVAVTTTVGGR